MERNQYLLRFFRWSILFLIASCGLITPVFSSLFHLFTASTSYPQFYVFFDILILSDGQKEIGTCSQCNLKWLIFHQPEIAGLSFSFSWLLHLGLEVFGLYLHHHPLMSSIGHLQAPLNPLHTLNLEKTLIAAEAVESHLCYSCGSRSPQGLSNFSLLPVIVIACVLAALVAYPPIVCRGANRY